MRRLKRLFEKQILNLLCLAVLLTAAAYFSAQPEFFAGGLWNVSTRTWFWLSIGAAILHQLYVWFTWRAELHFRLLTRWIGRRAFPVYTAGFLLLLALRFLTILLVGIASRGSWRIHPPLGWGSALLILLPAGYTLYSIRRYFSYERVLGIDHFDPSYRRLGLVRKGIFKYTANAMYTFMALAFLIPGLACGSKAALIAGVFSYAYLWVHYYTVEKPDMQKMYTREENDCADSH